MERGELGLLSICRFLAVLERFTVFNFFSVVDLPVRCGSMRTCCVLLSSFLLVLSGYQKQKTTSTEDADVVIRNARVYTVDAQRPWAQAVAIKGDRIAWVGDENAAAPYI